MTGCVLRMHGATLLLGLGSAYMAQGGELGFKSRWVRKMKKPLLSAITKLRHWLTDILRVPLPASKPPAELFDVAPNNLEIRQCL